MMTLMARVKVKGRVFVLLARRGCRPEYQLRGSREKSPSKDPILYSKTQEMT